MMTTTRPYLIRAFYDWIVDNDCTPHLVVNAEYEAVEVPLDYVESGQIVLNNVFGPEACSTLLLFKLEQELWPIIKPFMEYLSLIPNEEFKNARELFVKAPLTWPADPNIVTTEQPAP